VREARIRKEELRVSEDSLTRNLGKQEIAGRRQRQTSDSSILTRDLPVHTEPSETRRMTGYFMKRFFVLFLTMSAGVNSVCPNLGDGGDRIDDSYGNLIERHLRDDGTVSTLYHKDRYLYFVVFDNGVSVLEKYSRVDGAELSEKEIAKFLKANAGRTATWIRDETGTSKERRFKRSDHKAEATCGKVDNRLTLTVRELHGVTPEIKN
jgi:hypothetical protein